MVLEKCFLAWDVGNRDVFKDQTFFPSYVRFSCSNISGKGSTNKPRHPLSCHKFIQPIVRSSVHSSNLYKKDVRDLPVQFAVAVGNDFGVRPFVK